MLTRATASSSFFSRIKQIKYFISAWQLSMTWRLVGLNWVRVAVQTCQFCRCKSTKDQPLLSIWDLGGEYPWWPPSITQPQTEIQATHVHYTTWARTTSTSQLSLTSEWSSNHTILTGASPCSASEEYLVTWVWIQWITVLQWTETHQIQTSQEYSRLSNAIDRLCPRLDWEARLCSDPCSLSSCNTCSQPWIRTSTRSCSS